LQSVLITPKNGLAFYIKIIGDNGEDEDYKDFGFEPMFPTKSLRADF